jgi:hypothetical protein
MKILRSLATISKFQFNLQLSKDEADDKKSTSTNYSLNKNQATPRGKKKGLSASPKGTMLSLTHPAYCTLLPFLSSRLL